MKDFIRVMKALSDPNRVKVVKMLQQKPMCVCEIQFALGLAQPTISKHLKVLENAGLISTAQSAQRRPRKIEAAPLAEANAWLEEYRQFWERRYSALDELLGQLQAKPPKSKRKRH